MWFYTFYIDFVLMSLPLYYSDLYYEFLHSLLPFNISKHYCHPYEAAEIVESGRKNVDRISQNLSKICKVWVLINQVLLPWCFRSYGLLWLKSQIIKTVDVTESIDINKSILSNQFYQVSSKNFLFSHIPSQFNIFNSSEKIFSFK